MSTVTRFRGTVLEVSSEYRRIIPAKPGLPNCLIVLGIRRTGLQEAVLADVNAVLRLGDFNDRVTHLHTHEYRQSNWFIDTCLLDPVVHHLRYIDTYNLISHKIKVANLY